MKVTFALFLSFLFLPSLAHGEDPVARNYLWMRARLDEMRRQLDDQWKILAAYSLAGAEGSFTEIEDEIDSARQVADSLAHRIQRSGKVKCADELRRMKKEIEMVQLAVGVADSAWDRAYSDYLSGYYYYSASLQSAERYRYTTLGSAAERRAYEEFQYNYSSLIHYLQMTKTEVANVKYGYNVATIYLRWVSRYEHQTRRCLNR